MHTLIEILEADFGEVLQEAHEVRYTKNLAFFQARFYQKWKFFHIVDFKK